MKVEKLASIVFLEGLCILTYFSKVQMDYLKNQLQKRSDYQRL